jgi:hypothetical protein
MEPSYLSMAGHFLSRAEGGCLLKEHHGSVRIQTRNKAKSEKFSDFFSVSTPIALFLGILDDAHQLSGGEHLPALLHFG